MTNRQTPDAIERAAEEAYRRDSRRIYAALVRLLDGNVGLLREARLRCRKEFEPAKRG